MISLAKRAFLALLLAGGTVAFGQFVQRFGVNGSQGQGGTLGATGAKGESAIVFADGNPAEFVLTGGQGGRGGNGGNGGFALCLRQPANQKRDLQAADGGPGGNGGQAGQGGDGGDAYIYFENWADVSKIRVVSQPGQPGIPGAGGPGAGGCRCEVYSWDVQSCSSPGNCTTTTYRCMDGRPGGQGNPGLAGRTGSPGRLWLLNRDQVVPRDVPVATLPVRQANGAPVALSLNRWESRTGAAALLAPGSLVSDEWRLFIDRLERSQKLSWEAAMPIDAVGERVVSFTLKNDGSVDKSFSADLWAEGFDEVQNGISTFVVQTAVLEADTKRLGARLFSGAGKTWSWVLTDTANVSGFVNTRFKVRLTIKKHTNPTLKDAVVYDAEMPASTVVLDRDRFTLNFGQLQVKKARNAEEAFRKNSEVMVELTAIREFAGHQSRQDLLVTNSIRGF